MFVQYLNSYTQKLKEQIFLIAIYLKDESLYGIDQSLLWTKYHQKIRKIFQVFP